MKNTTRGLILAAFATTYPATAQSPENTHTKAMDIVDTTIAAGSFQNLAAALQAARLVDTLRGPGPFTVFAPTDEAFAELPHGAWQDLLRPESRDRLRSILQFHVVEGAVDALSALQAGRARTLLDEFLDIRLEDGRLRVQDANVIRTDVAASNGIIHMIDRILLPSDAGTTRSPRERSRGLLVRAIEQGVPLFNAGQPEACGAVYEVAIRRVLDQASEMPDGVTAALRTALNRAEDRSAIDRAWALRSGMDRALDVLERAVGADAVLDDTDSDRLLDFSEPRQADWRIVNDDVMGGVSKSSFRTTNAGTAVFTGRLSLENNGGFASARSPDGLLNLSGVQAVVLRVRGDGRTYAFQALRSDNRGQLGYWQHPFTTIAGEWTEIVVPLDELVHKVMGRTVPNGRPIAPERIGSVAFMIADKNTTPFRLEIDEIRAIRSGS